jgi:uncharacterized protein YdhG (YjbR/CyaY superfamily)
MAEQTISYAQYLAGLPPDRKSTIDEVWRVIRAKIPAGYTQEITTRFLTFKADKEWYVALANQKNYISLYLMPIYAIPELKAKLDSCGKKLKGGKSCVNFLRVEELPLDVIGEIVGAYDAKEYRAWVEHLRSEYKKGKEQAKGKRSRREGAGH